MQIYRIANRLEQCGLGRSITCLSSTSIFAVHPEADTSVVSRSSRSFYGVYGKLLNCELHDVLQYFNGASSLGEIVEKMSSPLNEYAIDITTWLLRFVSIF